MLHFAYGSNMHRALMRVRCPQAEPVGVAELRGFRFAISRDGYASLLPTSGAVAFGVLWRLMPRDLAALDIYESITSGLYRRRLLGVQMQSRRKPALVYISRSAGEGRPRPGYFDVVVSAARAWRLPPDYIRTIERCARCAWRGARAAEAGEIACPVSAT